MRLLRSSTAGAVTHVDHAGHGKSKFLSQACHTEVLIWRSFCSIDVPTHLIQVLGEGDAYDGVVGEVQVVGMIAVERAHGRGVHKLAPQAVLDARGKVRPAWMLGLDRGHERTGHPADQE